MLLVATPHLTFAQAVSVVRSGSFEVGGFVGATYGVDKFRPMGGGNVTYAINKWILPYAEFSYFPGIARNFSQTIPGITGPTGGPVTATTKASLPLADIHGGVHIRIPVRESPIVPYLVVGLGTLHRYQKPITATYIGADGATHTLTAIAPGGNDFAANFGGGIRYYISRRFGVRVEAKAYKPNSSLTDVFGKVEGGFFFQLR